LLHLEILLKHSIVVIIIIIIIIIITRKNVHSLEMQMGKRKGKASSLDIAPLTILNSGALQPRK